MGLYSGGLIIGRKFTYEIWGAYFREGLFVYLFVCLFVYLVFFFFFFVSFFLVVGGWGDYQNFAVAFIVTRKETIFFSI